ncbi:MAG: hypothetical protein P1U61_02385 [Legionellaceae bacterium]|nr:hypothetical protein [Legionellaceae bacterium]
MADLSPRVRESLLKKYYHGLGLSEKSAFNQHLAKHFTAQEQAFNNILDKYPLTDEQKNQLKQQLKHMQAPITGSALAFDKTVPGQAPTAVHPSDFRDSIHTERNRLLKEVGTFNLDPLLQQVQALLDGDPKTPPPPKTKIEKRHAGKKLVIDPENPPPAPRRPKPPPKVPPKPSPKAVVHAFIENPNGEGELLRFNRLKNLQTLILKQEEQAPSHQTLANMQNRLEALGAEEHEERATLQAEIELRAAELSPQREAIEAEYSALIQTLEKRFNSSEYKGRFREAFIEYLKETSPDAPISGDAFEAALQQDIQNKVRDVVIRQHQAIVKQIGQARDNDPDFQQFNPADLVKIVAEEQAKEAAEEQKRVEAASAAAAISTYHWEEEDDDEPEEEGEPENLGRIEPGKAKDAPAAPDGYKYEDIYEDVEVLDPDAEDELESPAASTFDLDKIRTELKEAQKKSEETLKNDLNKTVTELHEAAKRERDLIGWLLASECAQRKLKHKTQFSKIPTDYTVLMTTEIQDKVHQLHQAIQAKDERAIQDAGGIRTPSGLDIIVGKDDKGNLLFSVKFPPLLRGRGYYTDSRHNSKADLVFQAALVHDTGAESIVTNITHENPAIAKQLAQEAFAAARQVGFPRSKITIQMHGSTMKPDELFEETLNEVNYQNQHPPKVNVDVSEELAQHEQNIQQKLEPNRADPNYMKNRVASQNIMKGVLNKGRVAEGLDAVEPSRTTNGPTAAG